MLKWLDFFELIGYITAMFSISVSYASKVQSQHYSDFLLQNNYLKKTLFSPLTSRIIIIIVVFYIFYFMRKIYLRNGQVDKRKRFSIIYILALSGFICYLLYYLKEFTLVGAPMLLLSMIIVFFVEMGKINKKS